MDIKYLSWPEFSYDDFRPTAYFLHMTLQMIGKLKLLTPFEPQWSNVPLWISSRGLSTGPIGYETGVFSVDLDFIAHKVICTNSWQGRSEFDLHSMSVAECYEKLFNALQEIDIKLKINMKPQEVSNPIDFDKDTQTCEYKKDLVNAWWQILLSTYLVMQKYHARFTGKTPPVGFMWGTFDLRDVRFHGKQIPTTGANAGYIRRNAMNEDHIEMGWWCGNEAYPKPAYFSYVYPSPNQISQSIIKPDAARWDDKMGLFILDYEDVRNSANPNEYLLSFFESAYSTEAKLANWETKLVSSGKPI